MLNKKASFPRELLGKLADGMGEVAIIAAEGNISGSVFSFIDVRRL